MQTTNNHNRSKDIPTDGRKRCSVILLAAGRSSRMGFPKMALPIAGVPLIRRMVETFSMALHKYNQAICGEIVVVTGCYAAETEQLLRGTAARCVFNPRYDLDMAVSVKTGAAALDGQRDWVLVLPADHPWIRRETVERLLAAALSSPDGRILLPVQGGRRGHPLVLPGAAVRSIANAPDGWTLRDLVRGGGYPLVEIEVDDSGIWADVDRPEDLDLAARTGSGLPS